VDATLAMHFRRRTLTAWVSGCSASSPVLNMCLGLLARPSLARSTRPNRRLCLARVCAVQVSHMRVRRHDLLRREYLTPTGGPPQPSHGFKGQ
jgi:hypothetical protein